MKAFTGKKLTFHSLDRWMEMGRCSLGYFDSFARKEKVYKERERDRYWFMESGEVQTVSTLPLVVRWDDVLKMMDRERGDTPLLAKAYFSCNKKMPGTWGMCG